MMLFVLALLSATAALATALTPITNANIYAARDLWYSDHQSCIETYGHISDWDTKKVTNMDYVFCARTSTGTYYLDKGCSAKNADFNEDLSKWDVSSVTTM